MPKISTFRIGGMLYGIDILHIKEISKILTITPVPGSPPQIIGLMNLRGQIVSIIDLGYTQGKKPAPDYQDCRLVILKSDEQLKLLIDRGITGKIGLGQDYLGFIIDEVGNVIEYLDNELLEPPPHLEEREIVRGIVPLEKEVVILFDTEKLVAHAVRCEIK